MSSGEPGFPTERFQTLLVGSQKCDKILEIARYGATLDEAKEQELKWDRAENQENCPGIGRKRPFYCDPSANLEGAAATR